MNKEQSADDPSVDLICAPCLIAPFLAILLMLWNYTYRTQGVSGSIQSN